MRTPVDDLRWRANKLSGPDRDRGLIKESEGVDE